ncbi:MAG: asparagine synthase (glutamine-hydrolyzing) [Patescibacteria group bacterium]
MCGIAGIVTKHGNQPDQGLLRGMSTAIAHRGPDGEGIFVQNGVGFAHRRLAIIDVDHRADQPFTDRSGRFTIVYNGEMYNYRELRDELKADWKTESDTEVILEGFREWGVDVLKKLRGMFAFAIWDTETQQLFMARDRAGKKPFFYAMTNEGDLAFASEIKALRDVVPLTPSMDDVRTFLGLQYVPSPRTGFVGVTQLGAGTYATFGRGVFKTSSYHEWSQESLELSNDQIDEGIRSRLEDAVKVRVFAADVPVGAFLSGGVDSAAVVAYASKYARGPFHTFTMGFAGAPEMDERNEAAAIASQFKTNHHAFEARPEDLLSLLDEIVTHYDAPYADSSALPLWLLSKETAKHIKVVLTGDGGDETFGGYRRYAAFQSAKRLEHMGLSRPAAFAAGIASHITHDPRYRRFGTALTDGYAELFTGSYFDSHAISSLVTNEFWQSTKSSDAAAFINQQLAGKKSLHDAMFFDLTSYLVDDLNVKMDRATMRFGLEARSPFLDQELVQFALGLPLSQKVDHGKTKIALKRALSSVLPPEVLARKKRGFQVPLAVWFRGPLKELVRERCLSSSSPLNAIMHRDAIEKLIAENERGTDHGNRLWMLLTLSTWLSQHG